MHLLIVELEPWTNLKLYYKLQFKHHHMHFFHISKVACSNCVKPKLTLFNIASCCIFLLTAPAVLFFSYFTCSSALNSYTMPD